MNLTEFSRLMKRRAKELPLRVNEIKKEAATVGLFHLVENTPVDKGDAVSNWQVGVKEAPAGVLPAFVPGEDRSTEEQNKFATLAAGKRVLTSALPGETIHLTNNIDYIRDLDEGSSSQAPRGAMTPAALVAMRFRIKNAKIFTER